MLEKTENLPHRVEVVDVSVSHRLIPKTGVVVVEVKDPLRVQDFGALAATTDVWIESYGHLNGLVIHTPKLPRWESLGSFFRYMRCIREHRRTIGRVALVSDAELASLIPRVADAFVSAEVKMFAYEQLEYATKWAGENAHEQPTGTSGPA